MRGFLYGNTARSKKLVGMRHSAQARAESIAQSAEFAEFVKSIQDRFTWQSQVPPAVLDRDCFRIVDHQVKNLIPHVQRCMKPGTREVLDFGCGTGGSAIALAMVYPEIRCYGVDIDPDQVAIARERAKLYGVADRCEFEHIADHHALPFSDGSFSFTMCSSVLEYVVAPEARRFCVQEIVRVTSHNGLLLFSVPNRLYPFEIHKKAWGWNYFPRLLRAKIVDSSLWEVCRLARPAVLKRYRTSPVQLLKPWSNFCLRKSDCALQEAAQRVHSDHQDVEWGQKETVVSVSSIGQEQD
jgi:ubiquinone/menaquinone biosynthesis C-methylase UbiE